MTVQKTPERLVVILLALAILGGGLVSRLAAQPAAAAPEVSVNSVRFSQVRPGFGGDPWLEALVELEVRGGPGGDYSRFVDRVQVSLSLSVRKRDGGFDFFRASAEAVSLEVGRAAIRFYLPPEIVRREQINSDPVAYAVELVAHGVAMPPGPDALSSVLRSETAMRSFKDHVVRMAPLNDGVLVAQYDSPFLNDYGRETPSFRRTR